MAGRDQLRHLAEEEGHQECRDVRAVDVGVGHDDDLVVAQIVASVGLAVAAAERGHQVGELLVGAQLVQAGAGRVQDLAAQRQDRLGLALARLLGRAARGIALDQEQLGAVAAIDRAVGELARQAQLAGRGLARDLLGAPAREPLLGAARGRGRAARRRPRRGPTASGRSGPSATARPGGRPRARPAAPWSGPGTAGSAMNTDSSTQAPPSRSSAVTCATFFGCRSARRRRAARGSARCAAPARASRPAASGWCCSRGRCRAPRRAARRSPIRPGPRPFAEARPRRRTADR